MHDADLRAELEHLHPEAWAWALHCAGHDPEAAADVLQQACLAVLEGRARFAGRSTFRTWFFGVVHRTSRGNRRRTWWRRMLLDRHADRIEPTVPPSAAEHLEADDLARRVRQAVDLLSARQRAVIELVFYHDLTIEEAATVMGMRLGTARTHYARGKARLAGMLEATDG